jgi:exonuclease III
MKILAANCQGAGNRPTVRSLLNIQKRYDPDVVFLSETHLDSFPAECLRKRMGLDSMIVKPTTSRSGGVLLMWKRGINIQQINAAPNYIDVSIHEGPNKIWRLTGIYGEPSGRTSTRLGIRFAS